jgi:hypothetical protein
MNHRLPFGTQRSHGNAMVAARIDLRSVQLLSAEDAQAVVALAFHLP